MTASLRPPRPSCQLRAVAACLCIGLVAPAGYASIRAAAAAATPSSSTAADADPRRMLGVWSLTDNDNVLFNLRLESDGRASTAAGSRRPAAMAMPLSVDALEEQGRWRPWGNGVRVDYGDGWTDTILLSPDGPVQWSWAPGSDRNGPPTNHGKAVRVDPGVARAVGVYRIQPVQPELPAYTASLLSNGQAFNSIDAIQGGSWRLQGDQLTIDWASRWRTVLDLGGHATLRASHWAPGVDRQGPPTGVRSAQLVR